jgi:hypothetical protein
MARSKKVSHNNMPEVIGQIWDFLQEAGVGGQASPEIAQRLAIIEKKLDNLERRLSPERPTMNKQAVWRLLKLRPKQLIQLEIDGVLMSHTEGNKTVYYEDDVMRCYARQFEWRNALEEAAKPVNVEPAEQPVEPIEPIESVESIEPEAKQSESEIPEVSMSVAEATGRIDINIACEIVGRNPGAIYQLRKDNVIPSYKEGKDVYFIAEELREWVKTHPPRKYTRKNNETEETAE